MVPATEAGGHRTTGQDHAGTTPKIEPDGGRAGTGIELNTD